MRWFWDAASGRYRRENGRFMSHRQVRQFYDRAVRHHADEMQRLSEQLRTRRITVGQWQQGMRAAVRQSQLYSAAAAKGGWEQLTAADFGRVGAETRRQYRYLDRLARQVQDGLTLDGRFLQRTRMYVEAGRQTYDRTQVENLKSSGYRQERSMLHPADHCDECVSEAERGWVPLGSGKSIGARLCGSSCHCTKEFR